MLSSRGSQQAASKKSNDMATSGRHPIISQAEKNEIV
jgi:hypothetical protein